MVDTASLRPYREIAYGPLDPKVSLEPDFFTDFVPERREEIVGREAAFYRELTAPFSVDDRIEKSWLSFEAPDGADIRVRMYRPRKADGRSHTPLMFFHGGGWKTCSVQTHDFVPSYLCANAGVTCFSVEYRLAPEHKFPVGLEDCYAACAWVSSHAVDFGVDSSKMVVCGDSSGGNFAAVVALLARDRRDLMLAGQLLIYPVTDMEDLVPGKRSPAVYGPMRGLEPGPCPLSREYLSDPEREIYDWRYAPLLADDVSGLPPALFVLAECDSLVDDGLFYARRLSDAGVSVEVRVYEGMPHAFVLRTYPETFAALDAMVGWLETLSSDEAVMRGSVG